MKLPIAPITIVAMQTFLLSVPVYAQTSVLTGQVSRNISHTLTPQTVVLTPGVTTTQRPIIKHTQTRTVVIEKPTYVYLQDNRTFWQKHPKVKAATVGAGVGAGAGAVTGLISGRGIVRGAAIGAGTGAGVGLVRSSNTMKRHPIVRDVATGGLVGLGIGGAASRNRGWVKGAAVGSAVGLGWGLLKNGLN
jgi:hypothetical protein